MAKVPKSIRHIQTMQIEPQEIMYLVEEMARLHDERGVGQVDSYTVVAILAERYRGTEAHGRSFCIMERMRCLNSLLPDDRMRGRTLQGIEEGCLFTNEAIFRAAAKCPLRADAKRIWFDADEFLKTALSETEPEGRA
jgi:hypothetical protein